VNAGWLAAYLPVVPRLPTRDRPFTTTTHLRGCWGRRRGCRVEVANQGHLVPEAVGETGHLVVGTGYPDTPDAAALEHWDHLDRTVSRLLGPLPR
jgi:hypothetical protein